jgi:hypothetical protein
MMKRIVYYIIQTTTDENQSGIFHYSKPYSDLEKAKVDARKIKNDFVVIEKHHEYFKGSKYKPEYQWEIDHNFETEIIDFY